MKNYLNSYSSPARRIINISQASLLVAVLLFPMLLMTRVEAAQLTSRSLSISSAVPSASANYTFSFTVAGTNDVEGLKFQACTTAVGTCSAPSGLSFTPATFGSQSGWQGATNFAKDGTGANDCIASASVLCANRTDATAQTVTSRSITFNSVTNPSTTNTAFFVRVGTYTTNTYTASATDTGTVAAATVQTLTINANVAEVLNFCIGNSLVNDAITSVGADCSTVSGTSIHIGTLDTSAVNVSPVNNNGGDNRNAVAMLRTNAGSGATISYNAIQQSGTEQLGTLRISGATCNSDPTTTTDQCIRAQGTTQATFSNGVERFGMTVAAINCGSTTNYTCTFSSGTYNLTRDAQYDGDGGNTFPTDTGAVVGTTDAGYAWDQAGTADLIASSITVVDDETLVLKFASTPSITTPFGVYAAQADFIAVPTY